jgi:DNA-binding Lrp family transcriptional regulator
MEYYKLPGNSFKLFTYLKNNAKNNVIAISLTKLSKELGISVQSVITNTKILMENEFIEISKISLFDSKMSLNEYHIKR